MLRHNTWGKVSFTSLLTPPKRQVSFWTTAVHFLRSLPFQLSQLFNFLLSPASKDKERARRERILNVILITGVALCLVASIKTLPILRSDLSTYQPMSFWIFLGLAAFFSICWWLARLGHARAISYFFIGLGCLGGIYPSLIWGVDVPQSLLTYSLIIVMSGILISSRFSFFLTLFITIALYFITQRQQLSQDEALLLWRLERANLSDAVMYGATFFSIATISWLFNRESEKALVRARRLELALRKERNSLERKVIERTQELKKIQTEKINQLYQFAELGNRMGVLLHDLVTPLNVVSLNLESMNQQRRLATTQDYRNTNEALQLALLGTRQIESYLHSTRSTLHNTEVKERFSPLTEIKTVFKMLQLKAKTHHIELKLVSTQNASLWGNPTKFRQVITNLVGNAIDAYQKTSSASQKTITVKVVKLAQLLTIEIIDLAGGIPAEIKTKLFEQFNSSQNNSNHLGLGLSICKGIMEQDFAGHITCQTKAKVGTTFKLSFPLRSELNELKIS